MVWDGPVGWGAVGYCICLVNTRLEAALTGSQDGCLHRVTARFPACQSGRHPAANRYSIPLHPVGCPLIQLIFSSATVRRQATTEALNPNAFRSAPVLGRSNWLPSSHGTFSNRPPTPLCCGRPRPHSANAEIQLRSSG